MVVIAQLTIASTNRFELSLDVDILCVIRVLPLYKLIWNVHLSALMWHPDQMVFHVMTDHRRRRRRQRRCRYTTLV